MPITRLVPLEDLALRAQINEDNEIVGFIDRFGRSVLLAVTNAAGQIQKPDGGLTAYRSDTLPVNSEAPAITGDTDGSVVFGNELTGSDGTWSGADNVYTYRWLKDGVAIDGETADTYTPVEGDVDAEIAFEVTATNPAGSAVEVSAAVTVLAE